MAKHIPASAVVGVILFCSAARAQAPADLKVSADIPGAPPKIVASIFRQAQLEES